MRYVLGYLALTVLPGTVLLLLSLPFPVIADLFAPSPEWLVVLASLAFLGVWAAFATGKLRLSRYR